MFLVFKNLALNTECVGLVRKNFYVDFEIIFLIETFVLVESLRKTNSFIIQNKNRCIITIKKLGFVTFCTEKLKFS